MSRAFVRETEGGEAFEDLPDRTVSQHHLVTPSGLAQMDAEIEDLQKRHTDAQASDDKAELAESLLRKNLNSTQELFAKNHTEVAKTLELFADALRKNDHKHEADEAMARAKEIFDSHKSLREVAVVSGKTPGG